jgi:plastocyanin
MATKAERSPRSATQAVAAQSANVDTNAEGNPQSKMSPDTAVKYMIVCSEHLNNSLLTFVSSAAVLYIVAAYGTGSSKPDRSAVDEMIKKTVTERHVQKTVAYDYAAYSRKLAAKLIEWNKMGGIVRDILNATSAETATAQLIAWLKATKSVSSYNTLRIACGDEVKWTTEQEKAAAQAREYNKSSLGIAKRTRQLNAKAIDRIAEAPKVLTSAVARVIKDNPDDATDAIVAGIQRLMDADALRRISEACLKQLEAIEALPDNVAAKQRAERPAKLN